MNKVANRVCSSVLTLGCVLLSFPTVFAQEDSTLFGSWQTKGSVVAIRLTLNPDGTGTLDETPIKFTVRGNQLVVTEDGKVNNYTFKISGDEMLVSGGDLDAPLTFMRQGTGKGLGGRLNQPAPGKRTSETAQKETGLVGRWQSSEATVQIKEDGTLILNGASYRYSVKGNTITLASSEGAAQFPFQLSGDTLQVLVDGRTVIYKRITGESGGESFGANAGGNPANLFGKWCYMANVNVSNGGRMSNRCFTLYPNGTYEYYSETSSSGPIASSASQESDSGTWTATNTTITRNSSRLGTETYSLEKRNHPKTGDPMLVIDGDAYVTYNQRAPW